MPNLSELEREVHLWYLPTAKFGEHELAGFAKVLSPQEQHQAQRFAFEKDRRSYVTAHWLLRKVLSLYLPAAPQQWAFMRGLFGKPFLSTPEHHKPLEFNLSHTDGMVTCGVTRLGPIGVDVERVRDREYLDVARRFFASQEVEQLEHLSKREQRSAFFRFWTLKEAYIKALGKGLSVDLSRFSFSDVMGEKIAIQFAEGDEEPAHWQFLRHEPDDQFKIAAALYCPDGFKAEWKILSDLPTGETGR